MQETRNKHGARRHATTMACYTMEGLVLLRAAGGILSEEALIVCVATLMQYMYWWFCIRRRVSFRKAARLRIRNPL